MVVNGPSGSRGWPGLNADTGDAAAQDMAFEPSLRPFPFGAICVSAGLCMAADGSDLSSMACFRQQADRASRMFMRQCLAAKRAEPEHDAAASTVASVVHGAALDQFSSLPSGRFSEEGGVWRGMVFERRGGTGL